MLNPKPCLQTTMNPRSYYSQHWTPISKAAFTSTFLTEEQLRNFLCVSINHSALFILIHQNPISRMLDHIRIRCIHTSRAVPWHGHPLQAALYTGTTTIAPRPSRQKRNAAIQGKQAMLLSLPLQQHRGYRKCIESMLHLESACCAC